MTNYEKWFGTPDRAARSIDGNNGFPAAWNAWADTDGALLCTFVGGRGNKKTEAAVNAFRAFLDTEAKEDADITGKE